MTSATPSDAIRRIPFPGRKEFYRNVVRRGEPVVFTGLVESWKARRRWTFEWFATHHGEVEVPIEWLTYVRGDGRGVATRRGRRVEVRFAEFIEGLDRGAAGGSGYLIGREVLKRLPSLLDDLDFPSVQANRRMIERLFFMGPRGSYTQLHYDRADNLHAMLRGKKRWQLFAPHRSRALEPVEPGFVWSVLSGLDLGNEHMRPLEELGIGRPEYDLVLAEGETLYLPYGWWHRVLSEDATISTNLWWWTYGMLARMAPAIAPAAARIAVRNARKRWRKRLSLADAGT